MLPRSTLDQAESKYVLLGAGDIFDQELVFQEKRLRDQGTDATRSEQPGQRGDQVDNKNGQIAHRRIVAGWEILRNHERNNNSPGTAPRIAINDLLTDSQRSEQSGFANLVKGFFGMFRNPTAHEARVLWRMSKEDAEDLLSIAP